MTSSCSPVKFNIGGKKYEVSQSVLDRFPQSMLHKICSDIWKEGATTNCEDGEKEIFIDRDGERFHYILDFMRDGTVELPLLIPRGQFIADMEYFGLPFTDEQITLSIATPKDLSQTLKKYRDDFDEQSKLLAAKYEVLMAEVVATALAKQYFSAMLSYASLHSSTPHSWPDCPTTITVTIHSCQRNFRFKTSEIQEFPSKRGLKLSQTTASHIRMTDHRITEEISHL